MQHSTKWTHGVPWSVAHAVAVHRCNLACMRSPDLVLDSELVELLLVRRLVLVLEDVLEQAVVLLQNRVLGGQVQRLKGTHTDTGERQREENGESQRHGTTKLADVVWRLHVAISSPHTLADVVFAV